jgi:hypothetical protein
VPFLAAFRYSASGALSRIQTEAVANS